MMEMLKRFFKDEEGQGLVEYALIIVLIAIAAIIAMQLLGGSISNTFNRGANTLENVAPVVP